MALRGSRYSQGTENSKCKTVMIRLPGYDQMLPVTYSGILDNFHILLPDYEGS